MSGSQTYPSHLLSQPMCLSNSLIFPQQFVITSKNRPLIFFDIEKY